MVFVSETNRVRAVRKMAKKICNICNIRPVDRMAAIPDACVPCYEEGSWENQHQDSDHSALIDLAEAVKATKRDRSGAEVFVAGAVELRRLAQKVGVKNAGKHKSAELRALILAAVEAEQDGCWICHPELNEALQTPKTRKASEGERPSRKGQKINVPLRAAGEVKALVVIKAAGEERATLRILGGMVAVLDVDLGHATLHLAWDAEGRYDYAEAYVKEGDKKKAVRNVAEALRIIKR